MKRLRYVAGLLAWVMIVSLLPVSVLAARSGEEGAILAAAEEKASSAYDAEIQADGSGFVGTRLAAMVQAEEAEDGHAPGDTISRLEFSGDTALVWLTSKTEARVVVVAYAESGQMVSCGMRTAQAGIRELPVEMDPPLPEYFEAKAFLVDARTGAPLCRSYYTAMNTMPMRELMASSIYDYDPNLVLNLDDDPNNDFLVFDKSVIRLEAQSGKNTAAYTDGICTITNADEAARALKAGEVICIPDRDDGFIILRADTVLVNGDTVIVTEDTGADLEDVFSVIKIDTDAVIPASERRSDAAGLMADIEKTKSATVSLNHTFADNGGDPGQIHEITGEITGSLSVEAKIKLYHFLQTTEFEATFTTKITGEISLTGKLTADVPLGTRITIMPVTGVVISVTPTFEVEAEGKLEASVQLTASVGKKYDASGWHDTSVPLESSLLPLQPEGEVKVEGTLFLGLSLDPTVDILFCHDDMVEDKETGEGVGLLSASLTARVGVEFKIEKAIVDTGKEESDDTARHLCDACFSGKISIVGELSGKLNSAFKVLRVSLKPANIKIEAGDFYLSFRNADWEFGFGTCPHMEYKVYVMATDQATADPLPGTIITILGADNAQRYTTNASGTAQDYFPNGEYQISARKGEHMGSAQVTVADGPVGVVVELDMGLNITITATLPDGSPAVGAVLTGSGTEEDLVADDRGVIQYYEAPHRAYHTLSIYDEATDSQWEQQVSFIRDTELEVRLEPRQYTVGIDVADENGLYAAASVTCPELGETRRFDRSVSTLPVFFRLPVGIHTFLVDADGATATLDATVNREDYGKLYTLYTAVVPAKLYPMTVTVLDEEGQPASGAVVTAAGLEETRTAGEDGTCVFPVPGGTYALTAKSADGALRGRAKATVWRAQTAATIRLEPYDSGLVYGEGEVGYAILEDHSLWLWGGRPHYYHGTADIPDVSRALFTPVKVMENVASFQMVSKHCAAIDLDGSLWMWGANEEGLIGNGTTVDVSEPVKVLDHVASVYLSYTNAVAIGEDGSLWIWGETYSEESGNHYVLFPTKVLDQVSWFTFVRSDDSYAAICEDGTLWMWGENYYRIGNEDSYWLPTPVRVLTNVASVSFGYCQAAAIRTDGSLWMWGTERWVNSSSQIAVLTDSSVPVKITENVRSITFLRDGDMWGFAAADAFMIETADGGLLTWDKDMETPARIMDGVKQARYICWQYDTRYASDLAIPISRSGILVIKEDGSLWVTTMTGGDPGWMGSSDGGPVCTAVTHAVSMECSGENAAILDEDRNLWMLGFYSTASSRFGELSREPQLILTNVVSYQTNANNTIAITRDNALWAWGSALNGVASSFSPVVRLEHVKDAKLISYSGGKVYAQTLDGALWAWGNNEFGDSTLSNYLGIGKAGGTIKTPAQVLLPIP